MSEDVIVQHCSPTLAGLKTGSLFTYPYANANEIAADLCELNRVLVPRGLSVLPLRYHNGRALIYLFRPHELARDLADLSAARILADRGYPAEPCRCLAKLAKKLREDADFPHEIGLFLGYPPQDVEGFIQNEAQSCKCSGYWKVYGDAEAARKLFARFKQCTDSYLAQRARGVSVVRLAVRSRAA